VFDFPTETNRAVALIHYTNRFARTPSLKYIFSNGGGSIPHLAPGFAIIDEMGFIAGGEREAPLLTCCAGFIGTRSCCRRSCASRAARRSGNQFKFCMERIFRICGETWP
jgi:hypothetical protein